MAALYLYFNSVAYLLISVICTVAARRTALNLGYGELSNSGESEFRVVYGGLQLGIAAAFAFLAYRTDMNRLGVLFALALYLPVVLFRVATLARYWPVGAVTLGVALLECLLLAGAVWLLAARHV